MDNVSDPTQVGIVTMSNFFCADAQDNGICYLDRQLGQKTVQRKPPRTTLAAGDVLCLLE